MKGHRLWATLWTILAVVLVTLAGLSLWSCRAQEPRPAPAPAPAQRPRITQPAPAPRQITAFPADSDVPNLTVPGLKDHVPTSLRALGGPLLVNVWASWCRPCRREMPVLTLLHAEYAPRGLKMIGISVDRDRAAALGLAEGAGLPYRQLHDPHNRTGPAFGATELPATYLYDRRGLLSFNSLRALRADDPALRSALEQVLSPSQ